MRISDWSSDVCSSDLKVELLVMRRQGAPLSPNDALALAKQARAEVETEMKAFLPKRQEVRPVTGQAASQSRPQPTTSPHAMKMAISAASASSPGGPHPFHGARARQQPQTSPTLPPEPTP